MSWQLHGDQLNVAVLAGGVSAERPISLASGRCVRQALVEAGREADLWDPAEVDLSSIPWSRYDACFIALHGGAGEDGRVQQRLKLLKVPYTGSGPAASRLAMSKSASKERFLQHGISTPEYALLAAAGDARDVAAKTRQLGFPLVFKPDSQGSSLGLSVAHTAADVPGCLEGCRPLDRFVVAERFIRGREFTVAVLDRRPLPLIEIITDGGLFDYQAKYESPSTRYVFDVDLPPEHTDKLYQSATRAADALDTRGLVRVDLILDPKGDAWVLEVNTVPGLTGKSLAPRAAQRAGIDMPRLCDRLVRDCLRCGVTT